MVATVAAISTQLPYPYVHIVYWTVQLLLGITAIQTGCNIGVDWYAKVNGKLQCTFKIHFAFHFNFKIFLALIACICVVCNTNLQAMVSIPLALEYGLKTKTSGGSDKC